MSKRLLKLFWTLVGFAALNVAFAIFTNPHAPLPHPTPGDIARQCAEGIQPSSGQDKHARSGKHTHKGPPQKLNNYIQEQFSSAVICI